MNNDLGELLEALEDYIISEYEPSRERSLALTKLEECYLWLTRTDRVIHDEPEL